MKLLGKRSPKHFFPELVYIAEVVASLPVSNAWPERGASTFKNAKTRLRSKLSGHMLEAVLHVCINGPSAAQPSEEIVKSAVKVWLEKKNGRKLPKKPFHGSSSSEARVVMQQDAGVQTDEVAVVGEELVGQVKLALKQLNMELDDAESEDWSDEDDFDDYCY